MFVPIPLPASPFAAPGSNSTGTSRRESIVSAVTSPFAPTPEEATTGFTTISTPWSGRDGSPAPIFGDHDWYRAGARVLIGPSPYAQLPDGSWSQGGQQGISNIYNTCFASSFYRRVAFRSSSINCVMSLARTGINARPSDVHNLTQFLAKQWNVKLNWQIVDARIATERTYPGSRASIEWP